MCTVLYTDHYAYTYTRCKDIVYLLFVLIIAELAERSPIIIQNGSSNPSSRKNLDLRPYDRPYKVLLLTYMVNCTAGTALSRSPVVGALGSESDDPGSSPGRCKTLCPWDVREKKMRAPLLGLAKSAYNQSS